MNDAYMQPVDDGLSYRGGQPYSRYKLKAVELYLAITNKAMAKKWPNRCFVDLQSGPGKDRIGDEIVLGSPLLGLTSPNPPNHMYFNDIDPQAIDDLKTRVAQWGGRSQFTFLNKDVNVAVDDVIESIRSIQRKSPEQKWPLNVVFLDPEGLEMNWTTVTKLAQLPFTDLIINFATGGIMRMIGTGNDVALNEFFGTDTWKQVVEQKPKKAYRPLIDFYLGRLQEFGYLTEADPDLPPAEIVARNSRNAEVYSVIFASKHELGAKFWRQAEGYTNPPRLL